MVPSFVGRLVTVVAAGLLAVACGDEAGGAHDGADTGGGGDTSAPDDTGDTSAPGDGETSDPDDPFAPNEVRTVAITLPAADWDTLRNQLRDPLVIVGADCLDAPWPSPFTWFSGSVTIDGATLPDVGVRKKGNLTAYEVVRPPLRLDFDRNVPDREVRGMDDMVLNRAVQDPSYVRTCLAYQLFAQAGVPAPRCGFARVSVNGADLGPYVHVERIDKDFLERHFDDPSGNLYEGAVTDFRSAWLGAFELDSGDAARDDLTALASALEADDDDLVAAVSEVLDLDAFMTYWAMETLLEHVDGYSGNLNNFVVYHDPTSDKLRFIAAGADFTLPSLAETEGYVVPAVMLEGVLVRRLYALPATRATYLARLGELADTLFSDAAVTALLAEVDRLAALVSPLVSDPPTFQAELGFLRDSIRVRRAAVHRGIEVAPTSVDTPLRGSPCMPVIGTFSATFETTFGTYEATDPYAAGQGTMSATLDDAALSFSDVGAVAGSPGPGIPVVGLRIVGRLADGGEVAADVQLDVSAFAAGTTTTLDLGATTASLWREGGSSIGLIAPGTLVLERASLEPGQPVKGTIEGTVLGN